MSNPASFDLSESASLIAALLGPAPALRPASARPASRPEFSQEPGAPSVQPAREMPAAGLAAAPAPELATMEPEAPAAEPEAQPSPVESLGPAGGELELAPDGQPELDPLIAETPEALTPEPEVTAAEQRPGPVEHRVPEATAVKPAVRSVPVRPAMGLEVDLAEELPTMEPAIRPGPVKPAVAPVAPAEPDLPTMEPGEPSMPVNPAPEPDPGARPAAASRSDELDRILTQTCSRGQFKGAVLADAQGLPLAEHKGPLGTDVLAAFTSVLGEALDRAAVLLRQREATYISMDIDYLDKLVLKRFTAGAHTLFLMLIASQGSDERSDLELAIGQVRSLIGG